jgi:antitoxin FitA
MKISVARLTVRKVSDDVVRALRLRAAKHGRSAEAEHRVILAEALRTAGDADFWARADALRLKCRCQRSDSGELQRQMRDER